MGHRDMELTTQTAALAASLKTLGWQMGTAESCTGGGIAYYLTEMPGSSAWFAGSVVSYSNAVKQDVLGVVAHDLIEHGAVSEQVAAQMAMGALRVLNIDCAVPVSGVAGPGGATARKPVGMVCLAWSWRDAHGTTHVRHTTMHLAGDRHAVRMQTVEHAIVGMQRICDAVSAGQSHVSI